jgi:glucose-6-phosphate 1-epimerase
VARVLVMHGELMRLENAWGWAEVSPWGAQVLRAVPHGGTDLLWQTDGVFLNSARAAGKALRAGIPLCWPWFLGHPEGMPGAPSHGLGRILDWEVVDGRQAEMVQLRCAVDMTPWGVPTTLQAQVRIALLADGVSVRLTTRNVGAAPMRLTQALHTYVRVGEVADVRLLGLAGLPNRHVLTGEIMAPVGDALQIEGQVERVFSWTRPVGTVRVQDARLRRTVTVAGGLVRPGGVLEGGDVVVFNPGLEKAKGLDMRPEHYANFVCVETANIGRPVVVGPGEACDIWTAVTERIYT